MNAGVQIVVEGMVQGVGFRYFVLGEARQLNLKGFVRNLPNSNVEIYSEGDRGLLEELIKSVKVGPRLSRVSNLQIEWKEYSGKYKSFDVTY